MTTSSLRNRAMALFPLWLLLLPLGADAQSAPDSIGLMRKFIQICNTYSALPSQVVVRLQRTTNYLQSPDDTSSANIRFYLQNGGSYVQFGEIEQMANDSLLLVVNHAAHRIIIQRNQIPLAQRAQRASGLLQADSSVERMLKNYYVQTTEEGNEFFAIKLVSRNTLYGVRLPAETIEARFNKFSRVLAELKQVRTILKPIEETRYRQLQANPDFKTKLFTPDQSHFLVAKEITFTYNYLRSTHDVNEPLPVRIADRVTRKADGAYEPVQAYESFTINQNL